MGVKVWIHGSLGICGQYAPDPPSGIVTYKDEKGNLVVEAAIKQPPKLPWWKRLFQYLKGKTK